MGTWIVIPARNEAKTIGKILEKIKKFSKNIIVVDDGSSDKTAEIAKKHKAIVLQHIVNLGKGAALKTGCDYAIKYKAKSIVTFDADGQHNTKDIKKFINKLKKVDIVFGYRKLNKRMPAILRIGNSSINFLTKLLYNLTLHDTQCGFRAFTSKAYKKVRWSAVDYSMESEMIANAGKHKLKYAEVPIETVYTDHYKGTTIIDGLKIGLNMFLWKFKR